MLQSRKGLVLQWQLASNAKGTAYFIYDTCQLVWYLPWSNQLCLVSAGHSDMSDERLSRTVQSTRNKQLYWRRTDLERAN